MEFSLDQCNSLQEALYDLKQDANLLQLAIRGSAPDINALTFECLLRLMDYLQQHINDICFLCQPIAPNPNP